MSFLASYTWSKNLDICSNGAEGATVIPTNLNLDYGYSETNLPQNFTLSYVYQLPVGKGRHWLSSGGVADQILGGWEVNGVTTLQSGFPFTVGYPGDYANAGIGTRPDRVCNGGLGSGASISEWFNPNCFVAAAQPGEYAWGNSGRGILRGPHFRNWNIGLEKRFHTLENQYLQVRGEFYNAFNNVNFGEPNSTAGVPGAGTITSAGQPRIIQFGMQYYF